MARLEDTEDVVDEVEGSEDNTTKVANGEEVDNDKEGSAGSGEEEEEEEYEIESILDSRRGVFLKGEIAYFVSWKGYAEDQNSWVSEADAEGARELIDEYHKAKAKSKAQSSVSKSTGKGRTSLSAKTSKAEIESSSSTGKKGRGKSKSEKTEEKASTGGGKRKRKTDDEDVEMEVLDDSASAAGAAIDRPDFQPMKKSKHLGLKDWEKVVKSIETVEEYDDQLICFFETYDGEKIREPTAACRKRFPQKLLVFYESHLRWKVADEADNEEN